jgi:hypothetical protein
VPAQAGIENIFTATTQKPSNKNATDSTTVPNLREFTEGLILPVKKFLRS